MHSGVFARRRFQLTLLSLWLVSNSLAADDRVAQARNRQMGWIEEIFANQEVVYPPKVLHLRAYKMEDRLEVYAATEKGSPLQLITTFPILGRSGSPGPKRREGDRQVPEGCYFIDRFNPKSRFHLSLGLNYPNASDRVFADPDQPGSDIFIHGNRVTIGCLPIGDQGIERLYLICLDYNQNGGSRIPVHIFPTTMDDQAWKERLMPILEDKGDSGELERFWQSLTPIWTAFESSKQLPSWSLDEAGYYQLKAE